MSILGGLVEYWESRFVPKEVWWESLLNSRIPLRASKGHRDFANRFKSLDEFELYFKFRLQDDYYPTVINIPKITVFFAIDKIIGGEW